MPTTPIPVVCRRTRRCTICGHAIAAGETYLSSVLWPEDFPDKQPKPIRQSVCARCDGEAPHPQLPPAPQQGDLFDQ